MHFTKQLRRALTAAMIAVLATTLTGCGNGAREYPFSRDSFMRGIDSMTLEEVIAKVGEPKERSNTDPNAPTITYQKLTFDSSDQAKDASTTVVFKKDAAGKFVVDKVEF
ncbi:MAG: hypothetical protein HYZ19_02500 [Rhodocyclales bacterium]|nr:hypothetical protein [Rhodocyclales bacterium]